MFAFLMLWAGIWIGDQSEVILIYNIIAFGCATRSCLNVHYDTYTHIVTNILLTDTKIKTRIAFSNKFVVHVMAFCLLYVGKKEWDKERIFA